MEIDHSKSDNESNDEDNLDLEDLIVIDTKGAEINKILSLEDKEYNFSDSDDEELSKLQVNTEFLSKIDSINKNKKITKRKEKGNDNIDLNDVYVEIPYPNRLQKIDNKLENQLSSIEEKLPKSTIQPGMMKLPSLPLEFETKRQKQIKNKRLREKSKGKNWFDLPAPELTEEIKRDLQIMKMRSVLDPKQFYKRNDQKGLPKYFQLGKVVDSPIDYYGDRIPKKQRKQTLVEELMADAEFKKFNKKRYKEIVEDKKKFNRKRDKEDKEDKKKDNHYKPYKHSKKLKKNKKKKIFSHQ